MGCECDGNCVHCRCKKAKAASEEVEDEE